jgi:hypothetical protein
MSPRRAAATLVLAFAACAPDRPPQHEVTAPGELLTVDGTLREPGWSRRQLQHWDPARVHDPTALRQWDFFTVMSDAAAVNLTLVDLGFTQLCTVGVVDFATDTAHPAGYIRGSIAQVLTLSPAVEGSASFVDRGTTLMRFDTTADTSAVAIAMPASLLGDAASGTLTIHRRPAMPYLSLATPFAGDPHQFFYEQKIPGMSAEGSVTVGASTWSFDAASTGAVMDWGRGQWPSEVTWRWAAASGVVSGQTVSFNLGNGFGDATAGTENIVVVDDVASKLAEVDWTHDANDPLKDWTFRDRDGRLALVLHPFAHETGGLDLGGRYEHLRKGYGCVSGTIVLDDGRTLAIDGMLAFAEEMNLEW